MSKVLSQFFFRWVIALSFLGVFLQIFGYVGRDPDSELYRQITMGMASHGSFQDFFAPKWYGECTFYEATNQLCQYFYEHPPGLFWFGSAIAALGLPLPIASYFFDLILQIGCFFLIWLLLKRSLGETKAAWALVGIQWMPVVFQYSIRANHETPLLFFCLLVTYLSWVKSVKNLGPFLLLMFSFWSVVLIKGPVVLPLMLLSFLLSKDRFYVCLASFSIGIPIFSLEFIHKEITGFSFWFTNFNLQVGQRASEVSSSSWWILRKSKNVLFYMGCLLWYSFPLSLVALHAFYRKRIIKLERSNLSLILILIISLYVFLFCLSDRITQRYIFPAYWALGLLGLIFFLEKRKMPSLSVNQILNIACLQWFLVRFGVIALHALGFS